MGNTDFLSGIDASYKDEILTKEGSLNPKYHNTINYEIKNYLNTEYLGFLILFLLLSISKLEKL